MQTRRREGFPYFIYDVYFRNLAQKHRPSREEDLSRNVGFVLAYPP